MPVNAEGTLVSSSGDGTDGLRFDEASVTRLLRDEPVASPGACILHRAFRLRRHLGVTA